CAYPHFRENPGEDSRRQTVEPCWPPPSDQHPLSHVVRFGPAAEPAVVGSLHGVVTKQTDLPGAIRIRAIRNDDPPFHREILEAAAQESIGKYSIRSAHGLVDGWLDEWWQFARSDLEVLGIRGFRVDARNVSAQGFHGVSIQQLRWFQSESAGSC